MTARFVNPYTFIGLPNSVDRRRPPGHDRLGGGQLSGTLSVELTAATPLLLGAVQGIHGPQPPRLPPPDGRVFITGSGLHGAFRSLHEVLAGGCFRVIDLDFRPAHRDPASKLATRNQRLGIVSQLRGNRPTMFHICSPKSTAWFRVTHLAEGLGTPFRSGQAFTIDNPVFVTKGRTVCTGGAIRPAGPDEPHAWRVLVTAIKGRNAKYFIAGRDFDTEAEVTPQAWTEYLELASGAEDARSNAAASLFAPVTWPNGTTNHVADRFRVSQHFSRGQPMLLRLDRKGRVSEIRPAQIWRHRGVGTIRERIPEPLQPCHDVDALCPSCRVFGSADTRVQSKHAASKQNSYRGHVAFFDATPVNEPVLTEWVRAPLAIPRPSAGQFYLDDGAPPNRRNFDGGQERGHLSRADWGSEADHPTLRRIRGRKFYWRTDGDFTRGEARDWQRGSELVDTVNLIDVGASFRFIVAFQSLSVDQLGGLISCLQPQLLFGPTPFPIVVSLGGGKPFGFGSMHSRVRIDDVWEAPSRYLGIRRGMQISPIEAVSVFAEGVDERTKDSLWPQLLAVLSLGAVEAKDVWYPPGLGERGTESYDKGFEFWNQSRGIARGRGHTRMTSLPTPSLEPNSQLIDRAAPPRGGNRNG